jgi:hypothetical protein
MKFFLLACIYALPSISWLLVIVIAYFHKWIVLNQVYNMIASTLALHILEKVTLYTWLPIGPRPLGRTWWRFFL